MRVVYITYPWFLDFSIEYIKELSQKVDLHVFVVSTQDRIKSTIFNLNSKIDIENKAIYTFDELSENLIDSHLFTPYIESCESFNFAFFPNKRVGINGMRLNRKLAKKINLLNPEIIHFDDLSLEIFCVRFFLKRTKYIINVHDPLPHSGEKSRRRDLIRKIYYSRASAFITFSRHAHRLFVENYRPPAKGVFQLNLVPYSFYTQYNTEAKKGIGRYMLFFGRISPYKGVDLLLQVFEQILQVFPDFKLIVAGKSNFQIEIPKNLKQHRKLVIYDRYIGNKEAFSLIKNAEFLVCPYLDSTQSGVVMTAFAFKKPVVVSTEGGMHEAVTDRNGLSFSHTDPNGLYNALLNLINNPIESEFEIPNKLSPNSNVSKLIDIYIKTLND